MNFLKIISRYIVCDLGCSYKIPNELSLLFLLVKRVFTKRKYNQIFILLLRNMVSIKLTTLNNFFQLTHKHKMLLILHYSIVVTAD